MNDELLKPGELRKVNESLARCAACDTLLRRMEQLGLPVDELRKRKEAQELLMKGMLEVHRMTQPTQ